MENVEYVSFKIDGEWLTDFFRTRFWDEKCGFDKAIQLIKDSVCANISEKMCIDLLEGRKKFVGTNEFDYVDDNEKIRPLTLYLKDQEQKNIENQIVRIIQLYPYNYIDQYACSTSRYWIDRHQDSLRNIEGCYEQLTSERGNPEDELENGCTWFENTDNTAKMIMRNTDKTYLTYEEFAKIVFTEYEEEIETFREKGIPFNELNDYLQAIVYRNHHYSSLNNIKWNYLDEEIFTTRKQLERIEKEKIDKENKTKEEIIRNKIIKQTIERSKKPSEINGFLELLKSKPFDTKPTELIAGWDGFIDREGNFYKTKPIGVGWYNGSANCHYEWAYQYIKEQKIEMDKDNKDAKDYLIHRMGWCDISHLKLISNDVHVQKPLKGFSKEQEKTLFKLFELNNDDMKKYYKLLDIEE